MIEDRLAKGMENRGYQRMNSNAAGIYLYYRREGNELIAVSVIQAVNGNEITDIQYGHILEQIKQSLYQTYHEQVRLFSLVLTGHPDEVKGFFRFRTEDTHWIIDLNNSRLMIYEDQASDGFGLRDMLEELLLEERISLQEQSRAGFEEAPKAVEYRRTDFPQKVKRVSMMNSIIIGVNVVLFLIHHYSPLMGGEVQMLEKGALSWYYVLNQKEYYRVITSMFMHSDWSHLVNNMLVLFFVGDNLERAAGKFRYLFIYFGAGILAGTTSISYNMWKDYSTAVMERATFSIGASGAIFGVVGAVLYIVIINRGHLEDISARQMVLFVIFSLYGGVSNARIDQAAHVGGFIAGMILAALLYRRPKGKYRRETTVKPG